MILLPPSLGVMIGQSLFPLQSAMEYVSALGLNPETIVSTLSNKLGGRIAYLEDSYRKIGTCEKHIDIIRNSYKPPWKCYAKAKDYSS